MGNVCCASKPDVPTEQVDSSPAVSDPEPNPQTEEPPQEPEPTEPKLSITVVGARGLRSSDWLPGSGKPDCYCELKTGSTLLFTTGTINSTCEPVWFEKCEVKDITDGDPLVFEIYDKDLIGSDFLGKAILEGKNYAEGFNGELKLKEAKADQAYLKVKVKVAGKDLPPGPPSEFPVTVEKDPSKDKTYGIDVDTQPEDLLFVERVKEGPFMEYNAKALPEYQVKPTDAIVSINGKTGKMSELLNELKNEMKVECVIRRAVMTSVIFDRGEKSTKLGLEFPEKPQTNFLVVKGINGGAAEKHNSDVKEQEKLCPGDRIVSVGSVKGKASKLLETLQGKEGQVMLTLMRMAKPAKQKESGEKESGEEESGLSHWFFG